MCGIAGIYAYRSSAPSVDEAELLRIRDRMASRGPDGAGLWINPDRRSGFAHRRLSIIDLTPRGAQPMESTSGDLVITFNGEIYNYEELRARLVEAGFQFKSHTDTEVLLHLYAQKGPDMLGDLRGMYAFAIWDARKKELFLARDTYGIKPLYFADEGGTFRFASSVKALLAGGAISREADLAGQAGFYLTGSVPEPFTTYQAISSVPAGSWMKIDASGIGQAVAFETISQIYAEAEQRAFELPERNLEEIARPAFLDSVRHHLVADVPVGAFLSGGVDSGALVGLMRDAGAQDIQTLTLRFEEFKGRSDDEAPLAAEVAKLYQTQQSTHVVTEQEFLDDLPRILDAMDQPTIDGINSWFVSKAVSERGMKVAISGLGGDELLGGYPSFSDVPRWRRSLSPPSKLPGFGKAVRRLGRASLSRTQIPAKSFGMLEYGGSTEGAYFLRRGLYMPWELGELMGRGAARAGLERLQLIKHIRSRLGSSSLSDFAQVATLESSLYMRNQLLRDVDWASMAHSLEVRVPLVDVELLRSIAPVMLRLGKGGGKRLLANAPTNPVPPWIADRPKTGFAIPVGRWSGIEAGQQKDLAYGHSRSWARRIATSAFTRDKSTGASQKATETKVLALVTDAYGGYGGIAQYNRDFLSALASFDGVSEVRVLPRIAPEQASPPVGVKQYAPIFNRARYAVRALQLCMKRPPDVIFSGHVFHGPLAARLASAFGARLVSQLHGTEIWTPLRDAHLRPLKSSDLVLCVSRDTKERYLAQSGVEADNAAVLHNTVDSRFSVDDRLAARRAFELTDEFVILTVSRLDGRNGYKGHDRVLKALPRLTAGDRKLLYMIAGQGEDQDRLEKIVKDSGLQDHVRFLGKVPFEDLPALYRAADLFALPSTGEGFGIVFLEAMASGTPAIGLAVGGAPDALDDFYGRAVAPQDFEGELQRLVEQLAMISGVDRASLASRTTSKFGAASFIRNSKFVMSNILGTEIHSGAKKTS